MNTPQVAIVLVSHSGNLAKGVAEVAVQMAPDVLVAAAGGTEENQIGTSHERVEQAVRDARAGGHAVLLLADLGSAIMVAETVAETYPEGVQYVHAPLIEGAVAAAVASQTGADLAGAAAVAAQAGADFGGAEFAGAEQGDTSGDSDSTLERTLVLKNKLGLHARPAAIVARIAAEYDAQVLLNDTDATSVLALMGLALPGGAEIVLRASGRQASEALMALVPHFEEGFGEE